MFSCSHFSNFLSYPIGKQSAVSKRGQETTSSEDRSRSQNQWFQRRRDQSTWFLRRPRSAMENLPQDLWYPVYTENVDEGQGDHTGIGRASIKETCAEMDCGTFVSSLFESVWKVKRNIKLNWPWEDKNWLSKDFTKLWQTWRSDIWKREVRILLSMRLNQEFESPTITALTGESMGWSCSKRRDKFVWRIGNEE